MGVTRMPNKCPRVQEVKKVYRSSVEGPIRRGMPLGRWEDKVKEYVRERRIEWVLSPLSS